MSEHGAGSGGGNPGPGGGDPGQGGGNPGPGGGGGKPGQGGGDKDAHITVDNEPKEVREGDWVVSELKAKVGVDPAKVLAEITPTGLIDLDDTAHIQVKDGLRFMSHARKGGSS
jgi:hypothetical protein